MHAPVYRIDTSEARRLLASFPRQVPYALKLALDHCLFAARASIEQRLPRIFTLRTPWTARGLHVTRPTKSNLTGTVGFLSSRWYMESQVAGDPNRTKPGDKPIWQPLQGGPRSPRPVYERPILASRRPNVANAKTEGGASIGKELKVKAVNEPGYFSVLSGAKIWPGIYYRPSDLSRKIVAAYWLEPKMNVRPRYRIERAVGMVVEREWPEAVIKAVDHALRTAR